MVDNKTLKIYDNDIGQKLGRLGLMFNNINDNNSFYKSQLENQTNIVNIALMRANASKLNNNKDVNPYVDKTEISSNAMELFQRDCDIKKFNKIAMSDPEDFSHLERMKELFASGITDAFEDDVIQELINNTKLWDDLEL